MISQEPSWTQEQQSYLQDRLLQIREHFLTRHRYDISDLSVVLRSLEPSRRRRNDYRLELRIKREDTVLVLLELADLDELESDQDFVQFLGMIDENYMPIGTALNLNRLELATNLDDSEIVPLTRPVTYFLMSLAELVVAEEALMNAQSPMLLET